MKRQARTNKLIILGIDGMDPVTADRMVKKGRMPNLKKYLSRGSARSGLDMLGAHPTITPPCWTTLATGAYPGTHGITCYWRQSPDNLDAVVYNMDSRNCVDEQLWNATVGQGDKEPFAVIPKEEIISGVIDFASKKGVAAPCCRSYKILEMSPDGTSLRLWISNALDTANSMLWHPASLCSELTEGIGPIPPVSLIGGEDAELVEKVFEPSWDIYSQWQADSLEYLIEREEYDVVFSHLHNIDCAGHQIWHLAKTLEPWKHTDEKVYQKLIERFYEQTDRYLGRFLHHLDEGATIFIVSDHGLLVGENVPSILGKYGGLNTKVMEELGYTVLKKDEDGNFLDEVDWEKTRAVQIRSNYIYINLKGRDSHGIVSPEEKYDLEEKIISDLYNDRDESTGKRVVGIAMRNKDAVLLGTNGPECGDI